MHAEMFPLLNVKDKNPFELFQIWLNLPKKSKKVDPNYKMLWNEDIPTIRFTDQNKLSSSVKIVAGQLEENSAPIPTPDSWAANPENEVAIWVISMEAGAQLRIPGSVNDINRGLYIYDSAGLKIDDQEIVGAKSIELDSMQDFSLQNGERNSQLLLLQGKPINEPVVHYGPFVANTQQEIQEAISEYQKTQFGGWPWPSQDHVNDKEKSRFALFADGTSIVK